MGNWFVGNDQAGSGIEAARYGLTVVSENISRPDSGLSDIEHVDLADLVARAITADATYQAALQTTASIGRLSLLDFLR